MILAVFSNVREATKADTECKKNNIEAELVAIPKEISSACGIGIRIENDLEETLKTCMEKAGITYTLYNY